MDEEKKEEMELHYRENGQTLRSFGREEVDEGLTVYYVI